MENNHPNKIIPCKRKTKFTIKNKCDKKINNNEENICEIKKINYIEHIWFYVLKGNYTWCDCLGKHKHYNESNYYLTLNNNNNLPNYTNETYMLKIGVTMDKILFDETNAVYIYDNNSSYFYLDSPKTNYYEILDNNLILCVFFFPITKYHLGKTLKIKFEKENIVKYKSFFQKISSEVIVEKDISLPKIIIAQNTKCPYCNLDVENNNNEFIAHCRHKMHISCIFKDLEEKNLMQNVKKNYGCGIDKKFDFTTCPALFDNGITCNGCISSTF